MFGILSRKDQEERKIQRYRELLKNEAIMGGTLFGPIPEGVRREFFCLNKDTWIWHEEQTDKQGRRKIVTTRYEIRPNGVLKAQDGQPYTYVEVEEARRLLKAARMYNYNVQNGIFKKK